MGVSIDCPNFLSPIISGMSVFVKSYRLQIWPIHSHGPCDQKPIKNFGEKEAWAYLRPAQIFRVPPIISGTGKATNFKFFNARFIGSIGTKAH